MTQDAYDKGMSIRRKVLGDDYVDAATAGITDFTRDFQRIVTTYCWGEVWGRDGLSHRDRSMVNIAMISALNRRHELSAHVRGAINNGMTPEEIREVLLQVGIYCGVPAMVDSFRVAREVLKDMGKIE